MRRGLLWLLGGLAVLLTACTLPQGGPPAPGSTATWTPLVPVAPTATLFLPGERPTPLSAGTPAPVTLPEGGPWLLPSPLPTPTRVSPTAMPALPTVPSPPTATAGAPSETPTWTDAAPPRPSPTMTVPSPTVTAPLPPTPAVRPSLTFTPTAQPPPATATVPLPSPTPTTAGALCTASGTPAYEEQLLALINQERQARGLAALTMQANLRAAARAHSEDMACNGFFSHTGSDGSTVADRVLRFGYAFSYLGENIYAGSGAYNSPEAAFNAWLNSPPHRENMLNPNFVHAGIGYRYAPQSPYGGYWTADFGRP